MSIICSANHPPAGQGGTATRRLFPLPCRGEPPEDLWSPLLCIHWSTARHSVKGLVPSQTGLLNSLLLPVLRGCVPCKFNILRLDAQPCFFLAPVLLPLFFSPQPPSFFSSFPSLFLSLPFFLPSFQLPLWRISIPGPESLQ